MCAPRHRLRIREITVSRRHIGHKGRISSALSAFVTYDKKLAAAAQQAGLPALSPA
jgi:hypothetical protein